MLAVNLGFLTWANSQEATVRQEVKAEYDALVQELFDTGFALKNRYEAYRATLYNDVVNDLAEVRKAGCGLIFVGDLSRWKR